MARWSTVKYARTNDGAHLAFQEGGSGPPLVLFMDGFVSIEDMDDEPRLAHALDRMTRFTRAIRFDRRGVGLSDRSPSTPATFDQWLDDAVSVLDAAQVDRAFLFGDRGGAAIALAFAARYPARVQGLVIVNGYAKFMASPDHPAGADPAFMATVRERLFDPTHPDGPLDIIAYVAPSAANDVRFREWWDRAGRRGASPDTARTLRSIIESVDVRHVLGDIGVPTLVIHRRDVTTPSIAQGRFLAEQLELADFIEVPGADAVWYVGGVEDVIDPIEQLITGAPPGRGHGDRSTVLFADIVDSTSLATSIGDERWTRLFDRYEVMAHGAATRRGGTYIKSTGDGSLVVFDDPLPAVEAAWDIQTGAQELGLRARVALHTGVTQRRGRDIAGVAVHVAARVLALAEPNQILVTEATADALGASPFVTAECGSHELKGVAGTWRVFHVDRQNASAKVRLSTGITISFVDRGVRSSDALVLLPGPTDSWLSYAPVLQRLPHELRCIAVSQRGHGDSDKPASGYSIPDFASDVPALLDELEVDRAILVAHSGSCLTARRVALDNPERVAGLVLEASPTTLSTDPSFQDFVTSVVTSLTDPIDVDFARSFVVGTSAPDIDAELAEELVLEVCKVPARVWREVFSGLLVYDDTDELGRISPPALLIWGDADSLVTREMQEEILRRIPDAAFVVYGGVGHTPRWEASDRFVDDLVAFAGRVRSSQA